MLGPSMRPRASTSSARAVDVLAEAAGGVERCVCGDRCLLRLPSAAKLAWCRSGKSPESAREMRRVGVARRKCDVDDLGVCVAQKFSGIFIADPVKEVGIRNPRAREFALKASDADASHL